MSERGTKFHTENSLLKETQDFVFNLFKTQLPDGLLYHNFSHVKETVLSCEKIAKIHDLNDEQIEVTLLAAWLHDTGFTKKYIDHEQESVEIAKDFLNKKEYPGKKLAQVIACVKATKMPQNPKTLLEEIICDADLSSLGKPTYFENSELLRSEWEQQCEKKIDEIEYLKKELDFLTSHRFHTIVAHELYESQKIKNITTLKKTLQKEERRNQEQSEKVKLKKTELELKRKKSDRPERGIETMFRVSLRNHINLSSIADNKANIMLSINAIIISITLSTLVPRFGEIPKLIFPTVILLVVCLATIVLATLSTRPKVTSGTFTRDDIEKRRSNLLFFGNFYKMHLDEFDWGMKEMMKDKEFLYGSMIKDFYFLGQVLGKKYRYLSHCYLVFMYGLILSVLAFGISFLGIF